MGDTCCLCCNFSLSMLRRTLSGKRTWYYGTAKRMLIAKIVAPSLPLAQFSLYVSCLAISRLLIMHDQAASAVITVLGGFNVLIHFQYHRWFISVDAPYVWSLGGYIILCIPLIVVSLRVVSLFLDLLCDSSTMIAWRAWGSAPYLVYYVLLPSHHRCTGCWKP